MIPLILELKNFLSYGEPVQTVDFSPHSLICLSGKNGHGKSALLDALTWALWGQARKTFGTAKADEGLLRLGKTQMLVSLEFAFSSKTYRVRREFAKTYGKPCAVLDFEVFDEHEQKFVSLSEKTIRGTQEKIINLLGLDYETFTNSAFLKQGQSNEFSKKSARERKEILASILGLNKYAILQQKALDKGRTFSQQKTLCTATQQRLDQELATEEEIQKNITEIKQHLELITKQHIQIQAQHNEFNKESATYQKASQELAGLEKECLNKKNLYQQRAALLQEAVKEWKETHKRMLLFPFIKQLEAEKQLLEKEEENLCKAQQTSFSLTQELLTTKEQYHQDFIKLKTQLDSALQQKRMTAQQYEMHIKQLDLQQKTLLQELASKQAKYQENLKIIQQLSKEQSLHTTTQEQYAALQKQFEKRKEFYQTWVQKGNWIKNEINQLTLKQTAINNPQPSCPLCEQLLTVKRKQFLAGQLASHDAFLTRRLDRISILLKNLKNILVGQHASLAKQAEQLKQQEQLNLKIEINQKASQDLEAECRELSNKTTELNKQTDDARATFEKEKKQLIQDEQSSLHMLERDEHLCFLQKKLQTIETEIGKISFDQEKHNTVKSNLSSLQKTINEGYASQQMQQLQTERRRTITSLCQEAKTLKKAIHDAEKKLPEQEILKLKECAVQKALAELNIQLTELLKEKEIQVRTLGSLEHECNRLENLKKERSRNEITIKSLDEEINNYQHIASALSKNGIQALLIEDAIPEIESEANIILSRLTNNQASIFIESLKDLKSGGVKETLDIRIADTIGIRPYEMFSGGEAFRIDFALRIAVAKLLARRAGTALQTLIIDEGFGSQDEEGLGYIMEALHAIQNDFSKIIVVSHLQEFKHNFPVHLIIEKGPMGSTVSIEERG